MSAALITSSIRVKPVQRRWLAACPKTTLFENFVEHFVAHLIEIRPSRQSARQSGRLSVPKNVLLGQVLFARAFIASSPPCASFVPVLSACWCQGTRSADRKATSATRRLSFRNWH